MLQGSGANVMSETMAKIQHAANERHMLYRMAGKQHLTPNQLSRLQQLDHQLPMLWDHYRRELAMTHYQVAKPTHKPERNLTTLMSDAA